MSEITLYEHYLIARFFLGGRDNALSACILSKWKTGSKQSSESTLKPLQ
jgi:hypothetical protein